MFFIDFLNRGLRNYRILNNIGSDIIATLSILLFKLFSSNRIITTTTTITTMTISFGKYFGDNEVLLESDWKTFKKIASFLSPFHRTTFKIQGHKGTLDQILWTINILIEHYNKSFKRYSKSFQPNILRSWQIFDKYYTKIEAVSIYAVALILHPSRRLNYIKKNWKKEWQRPAFTNVKKLWESYQERRIVDNLVPPFSNESVLDEYDKIARKHTVIDSDGDEYKKYTRETTIPIQTSTLDWWLIEERRIIWPRLSQMAIDILSIPAISDKPERVFSGARRTISWDRIQLGEANIETTQCLKSWLSSGLISKGEGLEGGRTGV